jgi:hypothetical protein
VNKANEAIIAAIINWHCIQPIALGRMRKKALRIHW